MKAATTMLAGLLLAGCGGPTEPVADGAWVRLPAVAGRPAAAYFTLRGGAEPATLVAVTTDAAQRAELHRTMTAGVMASMAPERSVPLPAGGTLAYVPGGRHVMLFGMDPGVKPGAGVTLTFRFADGDAIQADANVIGAGDPAPGE